MAGCQSRDEEFALDGTDKRYVLSFQIGDVVKLSGVVEVFGETQICQHFNLVAGSQQGLSWHFAFLVVKREPNFPLRGKSREAILHALNREFDLFTNTFGNGSLGADSRDSAGFIQIQFPAASEHSEVLWSVGRLMDGRTDQAQACEANQ